MSVKRKITFCHGVDSRPLSDRERRLAPSRALLDRSSGKGTFASHEELAARHRLLSSFSVGALATTRTDFQFSRVWLTIPANEDLGNAAVQTASKGLPSMRATSCLRPLALRPRTRRPRGLFVAGSPYHHHGPLPHRWHTAVRCHRTQITPSQSVKASGALSSSVGLQFSLKEPSLPTAGTNLGELNPEQRCGAKPTR
ncbi:hypothetical protein ABH977_008410 [Bradyrhizobium ottawaense]